MPCFQNGKTGNFSLSVAVFCQNDPCIDGMGNIFCGGLCHIPRSLTNGYNNDLPFKGEFLAADGFFHCFIGQGSTDRGMDNVLCIRQEWIH